MVHPSIDNHSQLEGEKKAFFCFPPIEIYSQLQYSKKRLGCQVLF